MRHRPEQVGPVAVGMLAAAGVAEGDHQPDDGSAGPLPDVPRGDQQLPPGRRSAALRCAIDNLNVALVAEPTNADLQNWLGYAYRHEGKYNAAFEHYRAALQLEPKHRGAHEYIGETYLLTGNKAKAREHLAALERICGTKCDEYRDLQKAIASAK